jgi:hypothetical protein
MLPFGVTILATVPQRSENLEGLMNHPVFLLQHSQEQIYKSLERSEEIQLAPLRGLRIIKLQQMAGGFFPPTTAIASNKC